MADNYFNRTPTNFVRRRNTNPNTNPNTENFIYLDREVLNIGNDLTSLFLSDENEKYVVNKMYRYHSKFGGHHDRSTFERRVPGMMIDYAEGEQLEEFEDVTGDTTTELEKANNDFMKTYFYEFQIIPDGQNDPQLISEEKKAVLAHGNYNDLHALDLYNEKNIIRWNRNFRRDNEFPLRQRTVHKRHYERDNKETLRDTRDLENPIRGFNMENIYNTSVYDDSDIFLTRFYKNHWYY